jgi:hypothetical protein
MYGTILCAAAAGAAIFAMPAKADETVKWRHVHYAASLQTLQVGDADGHILGLNRLSGMAFFPDGSVGTSSVVGTYDAVPGVGSSGNGYYTVNFPDGSALWLTFTGTTKYLAQGKFENKGTSIVIGGKGRFAGAKGEGTFEGQATQAAVTGDPPIGYIDNVINVKK